MKISMVQDLAISKLNHEELLEFSSKVCDLMGKVDSETAMKSCASLSKARDSFSKILDTTPELISLELTTLDTAVDNAWLGMNAELENHLEHPNAKVRQAAIDVMGVWQRYADPTELPYEEEYAKIKAIIMQVSKIPVETLKDARVDEWFDALKESYDVFMKMWGGKTNSDSQRLANQVKAARADVEDMYKELVSFVNGWAKYAEIDEKFNDIDGEVAGVVTKLNDLVGEYNAMFAERHKNVSKCIEDILSLI